MCLYLKKKKRNIAYNRKYQCKESYIYFFLCKKSYTLIPVYQYENPSGYVIDKDNFFCDMAAQKPNIPRSDHYKRFTKLPIPAQSKMA